MQTPEDCWRRDRPIRRRGVIGFAARRAKELGADAIVVLSQGSEYAGTLSTGNAFTSGNFYPGGFNATTTGTRVSVPLMFGKAQVLAIKWKREGVAFWGIGVHNFTSKSQSQVLK